jgi:selenocysteine lyase/cysteine desulfurase
VPADFAALSFYKLFGHPTGVGALIARREALARLRRPWFAGGTVRYASVAAESHRLLPRHEAFEDGTPNFLSIAALEAGFALLDEVQLPRLSAHVGRLTARLLGELHALRHRNGAPLVRIYGPADLTARGGTIAVNVLARDGSAIPFAEVEHRAAARNVALRGGCFCNPGASEAAFGLERHVITACFDALGDDFTIDRFAACAGTAVGAVRLSLGLANDDRDVARAVELIAEFR